VFYLKDRPVAPDCHAVFAGGEVDMSAAPDLRETIDRVLEQGIRCVVADLSEATFIDSTCIGVLVSAHNRLHARRGSFVIVCANRNVRKTFEIAGLDQMVTIDDRTEEPMPEPVA
jgi:anti-sigma B factor antagonist